MIQRMKELRRRRKRKDKARKARRKAAIASKLAAEVYGLDILAADIEDFSACHGVLRRLSRQILPTAITGLRFGLTKA